MRVMSCNVINIINGTNHNEAKFQRNRIKDECHFKKINKKINGYFETHCAPK